MKYSAHNQYLNQYGVEVPSVTTILHILHKPALVKWANIMGFKRTKTEDILERASRIGTQAHNCIEKYFRKEKYKLPEGNDDIRDTLLLRINGFISWIKTLGTIKPTFLESSVVTDLYGGTIDFYGEVNGLMTVLDFKTSSNIYASMFLQLGAYVNILEEQGYTVDMVGIVHVTEKGTNVRYMSREQIQKYINCFLELVTLFHSWYNINMEDDWGNICAKD